MFHSLIAEGKKKLKEALLTLNRGILLVFFVLHVLTETVIILNGYFGHWLLKIRKKNRTVFFAAFFFKGF